MISDREKMLVKAGLSGQTASKLKNVLPSLLGLLQAGNNVEEALVIQEQDEVPNSDMNVTDTAPQNERWQFTLDEFGSLKDMWLSNSYNSIDRSERLKKPRSDTAQQLLQSVPDIPVPPIPDPKFTQEGIIHVSQ
jgi:hypothetical protein